MTIAKTIGQNFLMASWEGNVDALKDMLLAESDAIALLQYHDRDHWTELHCAAERGHCLVVELLLEFGTNPHVLNGGGRTAFHEAASSERTKVVGLLLDHNAVALDCQDEYGSPPLFYATNSGCVSAVETLLSHGAPVDQQNDDGSIPLHGAAAHGYVSIVPLLLNRNSDVNIQNNNGFAALHHAAYVLHLPTVKLLLLTKHVVI